MPSRPPHDTPTLHRRPRWGRFAATAILAAGLVALPSGSAGAATCPTGAFAFTSTMTNGVVKLGNIAHSTDNKGAACGVLKNVNGVLTAVVANGNMSFTPGATTVLGLSFPTTMRQLGDITGPVALTPAGTSVTLAGPVGASVKVGFWTCTIGPFSPKLTTGTSGALTGTKLVRDPADGLLKGQLVANDFVVPKIAASASCPQLIADSTNLLIGLPMAAGKSSITFDVAQKIGV